METTGGLPTDKRDQRVQGLVDHLFRRESARMTAVLTRFFGPSRLDLAEEIVQEALLRALKVWPYRGVPDNPSAWLYRVARNLAVDRLRRRAVAHDREPDLRVLVAAASTAPESRGDVSFEGELSDDALRLIFLCCHPAIPRDSQVALTLKTVCGFSVGEIARAFLSTPTTIAQRLVRAKKRIREQRIPYAIPEPRELPERLDAVLEALYLMFNEGYGAHGGRRLIRADVCAEACRLATHLASSPATRHPRVHAFAALLFFQASRLPARLDCEGNLVLLDEQDRSLWDRSLIASAFRELELASSGSEVSVYHLQAAIAAHHARAASPDQTDWESILGIYDQLLKLSPSPVVELNRAVAVARCRGPKKGLEALDAITDKDSLRDYRLVLATRGQLLLEAGDPESAAECFSRALEFPCSEPEKRHLLLRIRQCRPI